MHGARAARFNVAMVDMLLRINPFDYNTARRQNDVHSGVSVIENEVSWPKFHGTCVHV